MTLIRQSNAYLLLAAKRESKTILHVPSMDHIPGSVKMACSSVVLAIVLWTSLQFGVQFSLMSPIDIKALRVPVALQAYESYINSFADLPLLNHYRVERAAGRRAKMSRLPHVDDEALKQSVKFSESNLGRETRMENSLVWSNTKVRQDSPQHGQLITSCPSDEAMRLGKDALIATKASLYISHKHCQRFGIDDDECGTFVKSMKLNATSLGGTCTAQYSNKGKCSSKYRSADGSCNVKAWGKSLTSYIRLIKPQYADGIQEPRPPVRGKALPSARYISRELIKESDVTDSSKTLGLMQWTEFIELDLAHTPVRKMVHSSNSITCCRHDGGFPAPRYIHPACMPVSIPTNDPFYSKYRQRCMNYVRSVNAMRPDCHFGPAEQMNQATHHLDGSMIYGTTEEKAKTLRTFSNGRLSTSVKNGHEYLPQSEDPLQHCQVTSNTSICYASGDMRTNMHPQLTAMHTIWLREHNRLADKLASLNPQWNDATLYQEARKIVIAEIQHITYNEWMPHVLGSKFTKKMGIQLKKTGFSNDFDKGVNPSISNSFATAAIRFRLSMMDGKVKMYNEERSTDKFLQLRDHFNKPSTIEEAGHLDSLVRGFATQRSQKSDLNYANDLIQMLYKNDGEFGMDAMSLDIQRGRDHGLPGYNHYRKFCGLPAAKSFDGFLDVMPKSTVAKLKAVYAHPDDVDLLIGGMSERPADEGLVGFTFRCIIEDQMSRTKKGDRFFYDVPNQPHSFTEAQLAEIRKVSLARVLCDNADGIQKMQPNVFVKPSDSNQLTSCSGDEIKQLSFSPWKQETKNS